MITSTVTVARNEFGQNVVTQTLKFFGVLILRSERVYL